MWLQRKTSEQLHLRIRSGDDGSIQGSNNPMKIIPCFLISLKRVYFISIISIKRNRIKNMAMIFKPDLSWSFSLIPSIRNNKPLMTILISANHTNFSAPGQCNTLKRKLSNIIIIASDAKIILNFSSPEESFPIKVVIKDKAEITPAATPVIRMICAPGQCWVLKIIPLISSIVATSAEILISFFMIDYELVNVIIITQDSKKYFKFNYLRDCRKR